MDFIFMTLSTHILPLLDRAKEDVVDLFRRRIRLDLGEQLPRRKCSKRESSDQLISPLLD